MSAKNLKFAVLGTGNSGQCFAADVALKGYSVNLAEVPAFEANLAAIDKKGGIETLRRGRQRICRIEFDNDRSEGRRQGRRHNFYRRIGARP